MLEIGVYKIGVGVAVTIVYCKIVAVSPEPYTPLL